MQEIAETRSAFAYIDEEGILRVKIKKVILLNKQDFMDLFDLYRKLRCNKKKVLQLMEMKSFVPTNMDALRYASQHGK